MQFSSFYNLVVSLICWHHAWLPISVVLGRLQWDTQTPLVGVQHGSNFLGHINEGVGVFEDVITTAGSSLVDYPLMHDAVGSES